MHYKKKSSNLQKRCYCKDDKTIEQQWQQQQEKQKSKIKWKKTYVHLVYVEFLYMKQKQIERRW